MVQSGERILFAAGGPSGEVEAHVLINYQGEAEDFAWVVPVTSEPEVGVGHNQVFLKLEQATAPRFEVEWREEGLCDQGFYDDADLEAAAAEGEGEARGGGVEVLQRRNVGPYDVAVLSSNSADALLDWLQDNDYRVDDSMAEIIASYVEIGHLFVALRLQRDRDVDEIQPLIMRFAESQPCIPLRLTAIAAIADMPVVAYVLGPSRAIPLNYNHVQINWAAVDWLNYGFNYNDVLRRAADEGNGNAFATEFAGAAELMERKENRFHWDGRFNLPALRAIDDPAEMVQALQQQFAGDSQLLAILTRFLPVPKALQAMGIDPQSFYNCLATDPGCYREHLGEGYEWDPEGLVDELESAIVRPLREAQALFARHGKLTRLNTFISPEEMNLDPILSFNPELPDVSNLHRTRATLYCGMGGGYGRSPAVFDLPDGQRVVLYPTEDGWYQWPESDAAASVVERLAESGEGTVFTDITPQVDPLPPEATGGDGCACALGGRAGPGGALAATLAGLALGLLFARRRPRS